MSDYTLDSAGLDLLIKEEGYRGHVYDDYNGKEIYSYEEAVRYPTIGIGHLIYRSGVKDEREKWRPYLKGGKKLTDDTEKEFDFYKALYTEQNLPHHIEKLKKLYRA